MKTLLQLISTCVAPLFVSLLWGLLSTITSSNNNHSILFLLTLSIPLLVIISWILGNMMFDLVVNNKIHWKIEKMLKNNKKNEIQRQAVFITGCDSGFGNLLAQKLCDLGKNK